MRYLDKNHPYFEPAAVQATSLAMLPQDVKLVKAASEHTSRSCATARCGVPRAPLHQLRRHLSPTSIMKYGADVGRYPVGTGPFVFEKEGQPGLHDRVRRVLGRPALPRPGGGAVISDDRAMTASLLAGEVDLTPFIDYKDLASFRKHPNLRVHTVPAASTGYIAVNQLHPAMSDLRVRRAVCHAIDSRRSSTSSSTARPTWAPGSCPCRVGVRAELKDYYKHVPSGRRTSSRRPAARRRSSRSTPDSGFWPRLAELMQADLPRWASTSPSRR